MAVADRIKQVVVIDDDAEMRSLLFDFLGNAGYQVTCFSSAEEALAGLQPTGSCRADLIICDIKMKEMDGLSFTLEMKRRFRDTPIILITAFGGAVSFREAMQTGASDLINKPFSLGEINNAIRKVI